MPIVLTQLQVPGKEGLNLDLILPLNPKILIYSTNTYIPENSLDNIDTQRSFYPPSDFGQSDRQCQEYALT